MEIKITEEQIQKAAEDLHWGNLEQHTSEAIAQAFHKWLLDHIDSVLEEADWWVHHDSLKVFKNSLPNLDEA